MNSDQILKHNIASFSELKSSAVTQIAWTINQMWFYVLLVVAFCDIYWILRLAFTRLISFVLPRTSLLGDGGTIFSICWTNDLDIFAHMNNAKYYKEMDFGRFDFYFRSGLEEYITARSWPIVQHACSMRYRRPINFLVPFKLVTKLRSIEIHVVSCNTCRYFQNKYHYRCIECIHAGDGMVKSSQIL